MGLFGGSKHKKPVVGKPLVDLQAKDRLWGCSYRNVGELFKDCELSITDSDKYAEQNILQLRYKRYENGRDIHNNGMQTFDLTEMKHYSTAIFNAQYKQMFYGNDINDFPNDLVVVLYWTTDEYMIEQIHNKYEK